MTKTYFKGWIDDFDPTKPLMHLLS